MEDVFPFVLLFVLFAAAGFGILFVRILREKRSAKILQKLGDLNSSAEAETSFGRVAYRTEFQPNSGKSGQDNSFLKVSVDCPSCGNFRIVRENSFDAFFKKIGIACEIETRDPEFDRNFYILTDHADFASAYFSDARKREAVRAIFRLGAAEVKHNGKTLEAKWSPFKLDRGMDRSFIERSVEPLARLCREMPVFFPRKGETGAFSWKVKRGIAFAVPALILAAGLLALVGGAGLYRPLDEYELFLASLKYSLPLFAVYVWAAVKLLKGRSGSHRELAAAVLMSASVFVVSGFGIGRFLNGFWDTAASRTRPALVVEKYARNTDDGVHHYVRLQSWRREGKTEKLRISRALYGKIEPVKTVMALVTKPGRFGFEWIVSADLD